MPHFFIPKGHSFVIFDHKGWNESIKYFYNFKAKKKMGNIKHFYHKINQVWTDINEKAFDFQLMHFWYFFFLGYLTFANNIAKVWSVRVCYGFG